MSTHVVQTAHCHLLLKGNRWVPVGRNREFGPKDRCSPDGPVISAFLSAVAMEGTIVQWLENSAFNVQEVKSDGTLAPLDLSVAGLVMSALDYDTEAKESGAIGISKRIVERRVKEQNTGGLPLALRKAAFDRAAIQILDRLQGHSAVGVFLVETAI